MYIDILALFREHNIAFEEEGKNISAGWIGVYNCPYCGDRSTHLGFNVATGNFVCWACKAKGWIYDFIERTFHTTRAEAKRICYPFFKEGMSSKRTEIHQAAALTMPDSISKRFLDIHLEYLNSRKFGPEIITRYDLWAGAYSGPFKYRLIIPVYMNGILVNYLGRDITGTQEARYKNCPNAQAVIPSKSCIYNFDEMTRCITIVEGVTDVWRMGTGTVATLGTTFTNAQIATIKRAGVEKATLLFDDEPKAQRLAEQLASALDMINIEAFVYTLGDDRDPADLTEEEAYEVRQELQDLMA